MSAKVSTWLTKIGCDRWATLARALGVTVAYWLFYFSAGLPVGLGFFVFARRFLILRASGCNQPHGRHAALPTCNRHAARSAGDSCSDRYHTARI